MSTFTSAALGEIRPPVNILKEFLATFNRRQKCKAAILSWLDGYLFYGHEWVRVTFEELGAVLGYCRETISTHIRQLVNQGLIEEQPSHRFPKDTASEYRLNLQKLLRIPGFGRCEKIDIDRSNYSPVDANNVATYEVLLDPFKKNNTAAVEKEEAEQQEAGSGEQGEKTCTFLPAPSPLPADSHSSQEETVSQHLGVVEVEKEIDSEPSTDVLENQDSEPGMVTTAFKPSKQEIKEICGELKQLRINPDPCLGVVKAYWENVQGAIARVKEAINEGWCQNPTGLFINSCKSGVQPKNTLTTDIKAWFEWARSQRIVLAMSKDVVYTPDGEAVALAEMMQKHPMRE